MLELLHIKWEITPSSTLFSQRHARPHPAISATAPWWSQPAAETLWASYLTAPLRSHPTSVGQSGRQGAKEASSFIQHQGVCGWVGGVHPHQSFISLLFLHAAAICDGVEEDGGRLERPTGTEMKKNDSRANENGVSYLHPFFFMMFPSTTSALRGRGRRGSRVTDFENVVTWLKCDHFTGRSTQYVDAALPLNQKLAWEKTG